MMSGNRSRYAFGLGPRPNWEPGGNNPDKERPSLRVYKSIRPRIEEESSPLSDKTFQL